MSFSGVSQTTPTGAFVGTFNTSATPSITVPSAADEIVFAALSDNGDTHGLSLDAGATQRWNDSTGTANANETGAGSTAGGAPSVTMSWTSHKTDNKWAMGAIAIKPG
jgi:hypothetical protein